MDTGEKQNTRPEDPLKVLERRYANGEIERDEYLRKKT